MIRTTSLSLAATRPTLASFLAVAAITLFGPIAFPSAAVAADAVQGDAAAGKPVTTPSGLEYVSLREGTGAHPVATDVVKVNYRGTFPDGVEFDSSYKRNTPAEFPLNRVIKCWTEGVQLMKVGGKAKLTCPSAIAYGEHGKGMIPPNATLVFEIELLGISTPH